MKKTSKIKALISLMYKYISSILTLPVYFGKHLSRMPDRSIVFFPCRTTVLCCGLAGIVTIKNKGKQQPIVNISALVDHILTIESHGHVECLINSLSLDVHYLGGEKNIQSLLKTVSSYKRDGLFNELFHNDQIQSTLKALADRLKKIIDTEDELISYHAGTLSIDETDMMSLRIEDLKDIYWCLESEILDNIIKIQSLTDRFEKTFTPGALEVFKKINSVFNSIDRLEVRGRDSAGISLMFVLKAADFNQYEAMLRDEGHNEEMIERSERGVLKNRSIHTRRLDNPECENCVAITFTYKIAAEIGSLGDNVKFLRDAVKADRIFLLLTTYPHKHYTILSHTRWASMGAITEANCHPVDNQTTETPGKQKGWIHVCLNGDIDNYMKLKSEYLKGENRIHEDITTDTKIIPLQIGKYIDEGFTVEQAFRLAVNDFEGSHAIAMHTDLDPGKLFLAQKGSGQAIFVGIAEDHYMPSSEIYGFVEETSHYIKIDGDRIVHGKNGDTQGQILILHQNSTGGVNGIKAMYYDGSAVDLKEEDIKHAEITSRDIDRQEYPHYFLKEISEAPRSVEKTLHNRWKISKNDPQQYVLALDEQVIPKKIGKALSTGQIRRIFFIGQGTAGVAALACSNILNYYLKDSSYQIDALKASELSGFKLRGRDGGNSMSDALVVAISQSGTTADTNRTIDMVREEGGYTLAIVNRRNSGITFKVDGVMYTSSGRDIEMSVASTKAFYSQIVAGALLGLFIARLMDKRGEQFVSEEIKQLLKLPAHMRKTLSLQREIEASAKRLATKKTYWATVGSGPNKASADEIRIKLSELCYKTISTDFIEDKKHIDLSSEPLILICAAGAHHTNINDIVKETAIFQAHKATPIVIADEEEHRFDPYAESIFHVPVVEEHLSPILNTLVGHLWGYHAALAINEGSRLLYGFRREIQQTIDNYAQKGLNVYEIILERSFREKIVQFNQEFRGKRGAFDSDLVLLMKYLSGKLPLSDFELDFEKKGTARNMLNTLYLHLGKSIDRMARPVDAIKHQAKTVTVGTSRVSDTADGILFDQISEHNFNVSQLTPANVIVLKNLQEVISRVNGSILYKINNLNLLGELTDKTTIEVAEKSGKLAFIPSRAETDNTLKGTKRIIIGQGSVYIGMGRKDERSILIVPIISNGGTKPKSIRHLLLLNISLKEYVSLPVKRKALGGKYEHIKNLVQENSIAWKDEYLDWVEMKELFGRSAEKIAENIAIRLSDGLKSVENTPAAVAL